MTSEAEKFLLTFKDHFFWTLLSTADGARIVPRTALLLHQDKLGFYYVTKNIFRKISMIEKNPRVTVSIAAPGASTNVVAHCTVRVSADPEALRLAWTDDFLKYGYSGPDDDRRRLLMLTVHEVKRSGVTYAGVPCPVSPAPAAPPPALHAPSGADETKEALEIVGKHGGVKSSWHLLTWDGGVIEDRQMAVNVHPTVGIFCVTSAGSAKTAQIAANPNVALHCEKKKTLEQLVIDATATVDTSAETKKLVHTPEMAALGFPAPDAPGVAIIRIAPRSLMLHSMAGAPRVLVCGAPK